jgi:hypothetical protein
MEDLMTDLDHDDLRAMIDGSFGDGPAQRPLADTLDAGHRAVRRRRVTAAGAGLAAVLVLVGGGLVVRDLDGVDHLTGAPAAPVTVSPAGVRYPVMEGQPSSFRDDAGVVHVVQGEPRLEVRPGTQVLDQVDDPYGADVTWSAALLVRVDGRTSAYIARWDPDGSSSVDGSEVELDGPFTAWVAAEVDRQRETAANDALAEGLFGGQLVDLGTDGEVRALDGVELLEVVRDPYARDRGEAASVAIALRFEERERWTVIRRHVTGSASMSSTFADEASADDFAAYVRAQEPRLYSEKDSR